MKKLTITISRQFGSSDRTIRKEVAKTIGIPYYDSELIKKIAEESGFEKEYVKENREYAYGGFAWLFQTAVRTDQSR